MSNRAWVTLATNDSYGLGALVLAHSLRRAGSIYPAAVLITPSVTEAMRERLRAVFAEVVTVDVLDSRDAAHLALLQRPELGITFTKIHCWGLTQYEKCVFLDADTLVVQNCDELFDREELSAAPDVGWPDCFNSGVFVYQPSQETFKNLIKFAQERGSFDGGDQGLLNAFFSDWARGDINKHLPFLYNVTSAAFYSYIPALKHYGQNLKIIHFIGAAKPWLQQFNWESRSVDAPDHLREFLQLWWDLFVGQIHPQLDVTMVEVPEVPPALPPPDVGHHYTPVLDPESEFPWHHPDAQIQEDRYTQKHVIDLEQFHDPWAIYGGQIPSYMEDVAQHNLSGRVEDHEDMKKYAWEYQPPHRSMDYHDYQQEQPRQHYDHSHQESQQHWESQSHHSHGHDQGHDHSSYPQSHHSHGHDQGHDHSSYPQSHHSHGHDQGHDHSSYPQSHHSHGHDQGHDHSSYQHSHEDHYHHQFEHQPQTQQHYTQWQPEPHSSQHHEHYEDHSAQHHYSHQHEHFDQGHVQHSHDHHTQSSHMHEHQTHHSQPDNQHLHDEGFSKVNKNQDHGPPITKLISHNTNTVQQVHHVHIHHEVPNHVKHKESENEMMNGDIISDTESECHEEIRPRHPYDDYYLKHRAVIDSRGRKMCTHEIPPTPTPSPPPEYECEDALSLPEEIPLTNGYDEEQSGVAGNLARVVPGSTGGQREALDELTRRQGWEAGNIDYMGADSFDNIWAKISQTLSQPRTSPPKQPSPPKEIPVEVAQEASVVDQAKVEEQAFQVAPVEVPALIADTPVVPVEAAGEVKPAPVEDATAPVEPTVVAESASATTKAVPATSPVETVPATAPVEAIPAPAPVEAIPAPAPVEAVTAPSSVEAVPESAPVKAVSAPAPVEAVPEPAQVEAVPVKAVPAPATVEAVPESAPVEAVPAPAQVEDVTTAVLVKKAPAETAPAKEAPAPVEIPKPVEAIPVTETPALAKSKAPEAPAPIEVPTTVEATAPKSAQVPAAEIPATVEAIASVPAESEIPATVEACAPGEAPTPATPKPESPKEDAKTEPTLPPTPPASPKSPEEPVVLAPVEVAKEAAPVVSESSPASPVTQPAAEPAATPEKPSAPVASDSPPLANTPSKDEAPVPPAAKSEERRKGGCKLRLEPPAAADPLPTPDSEAEDAAALATSIIASELRTPTVTSPASDIDPASPPLAPTQPQRLSVDEPEVPTPPVGAVSLAQIGVKTPKSKSSIAAQIESSVTEKVTDEPATPTTEAPAPKKKIVKKVVKKDKEGASTGETPVPPPRKKVTKPKEK